MEDEIIILARITQLKDMQIFCLREEEKLRDELRRIKQLKEEREAIKE